MKKQTGILILIICLLTSASKYVGNGLTEISKLISLCNYYDNLTSNKTQNVVKNGYEAGKVLLSSGTQKFPVELIYAMTNRYIMNDGNNFSEMIG